MQFSQRCSLMEAQLWLKIWKSDVFERFFHHFLSLVSSKSLEHIPSRSQGRAVVFELVNNGFIKRPIISRFKCN